MAKKLKKKIEDICGLSGLDCEKRQARAKAILESNEWKQELCNELLGLSYRELERVLNGVASERQVKDPEEVFIREKLSTYSGKSMQGSSTRNSGHVDATKHSSTGRLPPRTLKEILAQVYAPKVQPHASASDDSWQFASLPSGDDLSSKPYDVDDEAGE